MFMSTVNVSHSYPLPHLTAPRDNRKRTQPQTHANNKWFAFDSMFLTVVGYKKTSAAFDKTLELVDSAVASSFSSAKKKKEATKQAEKSDRVVFRIR